MSENNRGWGVYVYALVLYVRVPYVRGRARGVSLCVRVAALCTIVSCRGVGCAEVGCRAGLLTGSMDLVS